LLACPFLKSLPPNFCPLGIILTQFQRNYVSYFINSGTPDKYLFIKSFNPFMSPKTGHSVRGALRSELNRPPPHGHVRLHRRYAYKAYECN
jgi:hypothetical protein